jgi:hypothetical protein
MSVLDDFVRIKLYRERASEFELSAETEALPDVQLRFRVIAPLSRADGSRVASRQS